jgi:Protein of unknown function (DUF3300)/Chaperone of endosialidase
MPKQTWFLSAIRSFMPLAALSLTMTIATTGPASAQNEVPPRTAAQLEQLVAPIALYPDALLSQVLMASTYPLEVVAAARWVLANPGVTGKALEDAMQKQSWDPSVEALTAVPQTLQMMNDKLDWTRDLGDTFLAQQADVLDAVQRLRQRADNAGNLKTTEQQRVVMTAAPAGAAPPAETAPPAGRAPQSSGAPASVYAIESTNPDEYYVPIYDPGVVYGTWPYPEYEPFYWYPPGWVGRGVVSFAAGAAVGAAIWGGIDWWRHRVEINPVRYNSFNRTNIVNRDWTHNPTHRGAIPYRDRNVAQQFSRPGQAAAREAFRGTAEAGRREISRQGGAGKLGQNGRAGKIAAGAAAGAAGAAAAKRATGNRAGAAKQARSTPAAEHRQASRPKQTARPSQGAGNRQVAAHRQQATKRQASSSRQQATKRQASAPRQQAARRQVSTPRAVPRRHASVPSRSHISRGAGGARAMARGGGRRSDIRLKHDITLLGRLENGLGLYRFAYDGEEKAYVGVMAQEVRLVMPEAVVRGRDGYFRVLYDKLGLQFQSYEHWLASGARSPMTPLHSVD